MTSPSSTAPAGWQRTHARRGRPAPTPGKGTGPSRKIALPQAPVRAFAAIVGASSWGSTSAVGGWVDNSQATFKVMNMCVFPDGSAIDEFGLWYHANGTVRGADLAPLFAYQPGNKLPAIFTSGR
jgi:putative hemolysin